jgi:hypothetical protein
MGVAEKYTAERHTYTNEPGLILGHPLLTTLDPSAILVYEVVNFLQCMNIAGILFNGFAHPESRVQLNHR